MVKIEIKVFEPQETDDGNFGSWVCVGFEKSCNNPFSFDTTKLDVVLKSIEKMVLDCFKENVNG